MAMLLVLALLAMMAVLQKYPNMYKNILDMPAMLTMLANNKNYADMHAGTEAHSSISCSSYKTPIFHRASRSLLRQVSLIGDLADDGKPY